MSVEAIAWVLNDAPDLPSQLVSTLVALANHATPDGRNSYPSQPRLAAYTRKSDRQIRRDLADLLERGLIQRGDQRIVEHIPQDRRPVVYDLVMVQRKDLDGRTSTSGRSPVSGRTSMTERADVDVRAGRTPTSAKPSYEPSRTVLKETPPATPGPPSGGSRGSRLPDDFAVTPEMATWARENAPSCGPVNHEAFCDYWRGVPGAKGRKVDWEATWRNWMRRDHERRSQASRPASNGRARATADDRIADIQALKLNPPNSPATTGRPLNLIQGELA